MTDIDLMSERSLPPKVFVGFTQVITALFIPLSAGFIVISASDAGASSPALTKGIYMAKRLHWSPIIPNSVTSTGEAFRLNLIIYEFLPPSLEFVQDAQ